MHAVILIPHNAAISNFVIKYVMTTSTQRINMDVLEHVYIYLSHVNYIYYLSHLLFVTFIYIVYTFVGYTYIAKATPLVNKSQETSSYTMDKYTIPWKNIQ